MSKKYSGKIEFWVAPKFGVDGQYRNDGRWEIDFAWVSAEELASHFEAFAQTLRALPKRDSKGRFLPAHTPEHT